MRALAKDREERYQSAREMQAALEEFVREERIAVSHGEPHEVHAVALRGQARRAEGGAPGASSSPTSSRRSRAPLYEGGTSTGTGIGGPPRRVLPSLPPPVKRRNTGAMRRASPSPWRSASAGSSTCATRTRATTQRGAGRARREARERDGGRRVGARGAIDLTSKPDGCAIWIERRSARRDDARAHRQAPARPRHPRQAHARRASRPTART